MISAAKPGLPRLSPGILRYTFDSRMLESGIDPAAMGLTRPNPTRVRAVLDPPDPSAAADIAEALAIVVDPAPTRGPILRVRAVPIAEQLAFPLG